MYYNATFKTNPDSAVFDNVFLPIKVLKEYDNWFLCEVIPHRNPRHSYGISKPYKVTIDKYDLSHGVVVVKEFRGGECWYERYVQKLY